MKCHKHHGVLGAAAGFSPIFWWFFCVKNQTVQSGAPKIAKLVQITPITMVYGTYNYS